MHASSPTVGGGRMAADVIFIVNPASANGKTRRRWKGYETSMRRVLGAPFDVRMTERPWHAAELTKAAVQSGASLVVAVGGDGTLNEAVNGMLDGTGRPWNREARLGLFGVGTGSDFGKTFGLPRDPDEVATRLRAARERRLDVGVCLYTHAGAPRARYFINIGEFGSGGAVVDRVNRTTKIFGGRVSFLIAILRTLRNYRNTRVAYRADSGARQEIVMNDFVVANGRFFGGGLQPAPHADPSDGLFDVVVIGDVDFRTVRRDLGRLRAGTHLDLPYVTHFRCRALDVESGDEMIDLDGEFVGRHPTRFELVPSAIRLIV